MLFAAIGVLGLQYGRDRQAANLSLEHGRQVIETLDRLRTIIADLEAERHGYLLTLDPAYLKAYGVSDESVRREAQALQALVATDPLQTYRAGHLALILSAKLREIDDIVKAAARDRAASAAQTMIRGMDDIRLQIDLIEDYERLLLVNREKHADELEQRRTRLTVVAIVIVIVLAGVALAFARLEGTRRRKATEENVQLHSDLAERDRKIRRLFESNIIGIMIWELEGRILEANDAFLRIVGYDREDLVAGRLHRRMLTPSDWHNLDARNVTELGLVGTIPPFEKEYLRKDGRRVPVLIGGTMFEPSRNQGVGFVLDLTEQKRVEAEARENERRYREALMELAHANRVTTMGQLTASIAHEVSQPIAAVVTNAQAGSLWLDAQPPNLEEVRQSLGYIVSDAMRAGDVIGRIRALVRKAPPQRVALAINEVVLEVIALTHAEVAKNRVSVRTQLADGLPRIHADRVQLQQVILNLIVNAVEAMSSVGSGGRELQIGTSRNAANGILVSLRDSGPGLDPKNVDYLFDAFYTTKAQGMGMGLAICRSIIEAHGGRMWAGANEPRGAVFQFTLPLEEDEAVPARQAGPVPAM
ncbi:ATP-binding protein [Bradyrhizobium sp.]|uniref:ATP-binding protein n=1 Tax=Bradyrhizobium sp. TaxID=376 RepID=UPI002C43E3B2|nr:ATP-binding protein [Bradyrhizobium sp.]HWX56926.1 ATP-binding protein [Bradyrhizobium sp.]